ncbi:AraC family transcriptional regulator [Paenibacillus sp. IB182496]|uniref:AraC family transcriptional regulator n=1 Tax=Paenibacillus sabuli TaxID=2772509 RepID=A0A927GRE7_9BACL|nr:helix-turn-helix domain-containing protein [Paenibacillus sabuli]MBD2844637.1 AraC family transcriptional regulator [Paenibacillus sabuli]
MRESRNKTAVHHLFSELVHYCILEELHLPERTDHTVVVIAGGMGTVTVQGRKNPISAGSCYYAWPGMHLQIQPFFNEVSAYAFHFDRVERRSNAGGQERGYMMRPDGAAPWGELTPREPERLIRLTVELARIMLAEGAVTDVERERMFSEWLFELLRPAADVQRQGEQGEQAVRRIVGFVETHYHLELRRDELAEIAGLSPEYFSVVFKQVSGKSLTDYVTELRIRHMKERLLFGESRLGELAREAGYKDEFYASRRFKQEVGRSPKQYSQTDKRIVSLNPHLTMHLLALGVIPAATLAYPWGFGNDYDAMLNRGKCEVRDWADGFSYAELASLRPEMIVTIDNIEPDLLRDFRRLAPTLVVPWYLRDWRGHFETLASAVRRRERRREWLTAFERRRAELVRFRSAQGAGGRETWTVINIRAHDNVLLYLKRGMGTQVVYGELGGHAPAPVHKAVGDRSSLAVALNDILPAYEADRLIVAVAPAREARQTAQALLDSPACRGYQARGGRVFLAEMSRWHGYDPISISWQLEDLRKWLVL